MKHFIGLILIGLITQYGSADVSHLSKQSHNGYLPPQPAYNLPIDQDYNGINSQSHEGVGQAQAQSGYDTESRGYLPPYQEHSQHQNHIEQHQDERGYLPPLKQQNQITHNHQHNPQEEDRGYLPPPKEPNQFQTQHHQHEHQEENKGYLPPLKEQSQILTQNHQHNHQGENRGYLPPHQGQLHIQENQHSHNDQHQDEQRGYLPPFQQQVQDHDHHHLAQPHQDGGFDPNVEISYNNDFAIPRQRDHINQQPNTEHTKLSNSDDQYEDNSHGYNYSPPKHGFEEEHQQQEQQQISFNGAPQGHLNLSPASQAPVSPYPKDQQNYFQSSQEPNFKQNLDYLPPNNVKPEHLNEQDPQQANRDYLPPIPLSQLQTHTHFYQAQKQDDSSSSFLNKPFEQNLQENERGYLPPIGALELPKSSDTLHIVPPTKLGLPITQSKKEPEARGHINVPLPVPQAGYYFVPGVVTELPSLTETKSQQFRPAINIPAVTSEQQFSTNHISPAEYSRSTDAEIRIIPSIQTAQDIASQGHLSPNQIISEHEHIADINYSSPTSNHLDGQGQQFFPPLSQTQPDYFVDQNIEQNQNKVQNTHHHKDHSQSSFENFAISAVHGVSNQQNQISKHPDSGNSQENSYLPPINEFQQQQAFEHQDQQVYNNLNIQQPENYNQVTNLQTYMDSVNSNDRYGSLQFQPQPATQSNPPPIVPPPMFSKPSAIRAYAPGMAYKVSTNDVPFTSFSQAGYLPPVTNSRSEENQNEYSSSIGFELNEEAKKSLSQQLLQDNTVFPATNMLGIQDDEMSQIMEQLGDHIQSIQITNQHDNSIENINTLDLSQSQQAGGVRKIEILGQCNENPMGNRKILQVISKVPNPLGVHQTIKIYTDSTEVALPRNNNYLPPYPTTINTNVRRLRQTSRRSH